MAPHECSGHSHDHEHQEDNLGLSLRPQIDLPNVFCLNEEVEHAGRSVLKTHDQRMSAEPSLTSPEDDPELLLHIPFTEAVSVHSISVRSMSSAEETAAPKTIKLFTNRDDLDFETAREMTAPMRIELLPPDHFVDGSIDYPMRPAGRFQNISSLTIFVQDNYDADGELPTEITFVGLKGKGTKMKRTAVEAIYETQGQLSDHKTPGGEMGSRHFV